MYLVTGATGNVGGSLARQLHEHGHRVRALVRDPSRAASLPTGKGYLLTGPQALTTREQVQTIAQVIGRSIDFEDVTPREFAQLSIARGTPPVQAHQMERLHEVLRARTQVNITDDVENITGTAAGTFRGWCERNAGTFR